MHPHQRQLIEKYAKPVPRYTSYPTAPHFHDGVDTDTYREWLSALQTGDTLSLYLHIPYCDTLCWFCGCHTKHTLKYQPVRDYLPPLMKEITTVAKLTGKGPKVSRIHWGGGSPTILNPDDIRRLAGHIQSAFESTDTLEFSIEIDPRELSDAQMDAMAEAGLTRASIGVQDFNPHVQRKINRIQSFDETKRVVDGLRARGVRSLNLDVMYGLPDQTAEDVMATVEKVIALNPDRIAFFGYAHVPWMKKHQNMISQDSLPDTIERFTQSEQAAELLVKAGYQKIGLDHFARPADALAQAAREDRLVRNFQGYTEDDADALIGFGASAIGRMPRGYIQNTTAISEYIRGVNTEGLSIAKGYVFTPEDNLRAHLIERLMCDYRVDGDALMQQFGSSAGPVLSEMREVAENDPDKFLVQDGNVYFIAEDGRPFVRSIAANFDTFLATGKARHSVAV